jgi:hypothetical protein
MDFPAVEFEAEEERVLDDLRDVQPGKASQKVITFITFNSATPRLKPCLCGKLSDFSLTILSLRSLVEAGLLPHSYP